jgi:hypothetical protein
MILSASLKIAFHSLNRQKPVKVAAAPWYDEAASFLCAENRPKL